MRREENLAYISSNRPAASLGLIPKNRHYSEEQMRGALIFADSDARRQISVSGMGEFSLPPDRIKLIVVVTSTKPSVDEAKKSVIRRLRYIEQTLRNHGVKDQDKSVVQSTTRRDTMYEVTAEVTATFIDIHRYELAHNHLVEKLDTPVVRVLEPHFFHSTLRLENLKRQASVQAVRNAKHTAEDIARTLSLHVAKAVIIAEESYQEKEGIPTSANIPTGQPASFQNLIDARSITVNVTLNVTFELKAKERQRKKEQITTRS